MPVLAFWSGLSPRAHANRYCGHSWSLSPRYCWVVSWSLITCYLMLLEKFPCCYLPPMPWMHSTVWRWGRVPIFPHGVPSSFYYLAAYSSLHWRFTSSVGSLIEKTGVDIPFQDYCHLSRMLCVFSCLLIGANRHLVCSDMCSWFTLFEVVLPETLPLSIAPIHQVSQSRSDNVTRICWAPDQD